MSIAITGVSMVTTGMQKTTVAIAHDIKAAADKIVGAIESRLATKPKDGKPLFVLMGENHAIAAHIVLQMLVLHKLKKKGISVAVGLEEPEFAFYEELKRYARHKFPGKYTEGEIAVSLEQFKMNQRIARENRTREAMAKCHLINRGFSRFSGRLRDYFMIYANIDAACNDAFRLPSGVIDISHIPNAKAIKNLKGTVSEAFAIPFHSPDGMQLRNEIMAQNAVNHSKTQQTDIYLQVCGSDHIAGNARRNINFLQSLSYLYERLGESFLAIPIFYGEFVYRHPDGELYANINTKFSPEIFPNDYKNSPHILNDIWLTDTGFYYTGHEGILYPDSTILGDEENWLKTVLAQTDLKAHKSAGNDYIMTLFVKKLEEECSKFFRFLGTLKPTMPASEKPELSPQ